MTTNPTAYASDEDVALRASADFALLCPRDQCLAAGTDGAFDPDDRWTLKSSAVDFQSNGLAAGNVVLLFQPVTTYRPPGEVFAVDSVGANAVTLRRKGQPAGSGQPAGTAGGLANVEFVATTLGPQIALASYDLNRRYGVDDLVAGRRPCDLFDPREVREATVLTVLYRQYLEMSRGPGETSDTFSAKAQAYKQELDDLLARTVVHWAASLGTPAAQVPSTRFGTRITR
jgi:hypothetical protein